MEILNVCASHVLNSYANSELIGIWLVFRINQRGKEQERALILTTQGIYRCKFSANGEKVVHVKEYLLGNLQSIRKGYLDPNKTKYGIHLIFKDPKATSQYYFSPFGKGCNFFFFSFFFGLKKKN